MKTTLFSCVLVAVCLGVQSNQQARKHNLPGYWLSLVPTRSPPPQSTAMTSPSTTTTTATHHDRRLPFYRTHPSGRNTIMMDADMDKMPPNSHMLTESPPNFAMLPTTNRIVNGHDTHIGDYPYQLQLSVYRQQICGATIIGREWAITAAHCMFNNAGFKIPLNSLTLRAGATERNRGGSIHTVETRVIPAPYKPGQHDHDLALLKVSQPFVFSNTIRPIALPKQNEELPDGDVGVLTGWGHTASGGTSSEVLKYVLVPLVNHDKCSRAYNTPTRKITARMLCAGAPQKDSCQGDSGGPLVVNGRLVGIVSFGIGCALPGYPGVNTKVSVYRTFISKYTGV